jgi:hypothetical protein
LALAAVIQRVHGGDASPAAAHCGLKDVSTDLSIASNAKQHANSAGNSYNNL